MKKYFFTAAILLPFISLAADQIQIFKPPASNNITFTDLVNKFGDIANLIIPFLVSIAVVVILWGIFRYVSASGDGEKIAEGRKTIIFGLVALFLMLSFWGLVMAVKKSIFG